jgi:ferric-dicitrate binding protein FerR (iron transport regulator)
MTQVPFSSDLIIRYCQGILSEQEKLMVENWKSLDKTNEIELNKIVKAWESSSRIGQETTFDEQAAWNKFQKAHLKSNSILVSNNRYTWLGIAASILLAVGLAYLFIDRFDTKPTYITHSSQSVEKLVYLPDSSRVWLQPNSTLQYLEADFKENKNRKVRFTGEGFFKITKKHGLPFKIIGEQTITEVLGTSFKLKSFANGPEEIEVLTGKVRYSYTNSSIVLLTRGLKASVINQKLSTESYDVKGKSLQRENYIRFSNISLEEVAK